MRAARAHLRAGDKDSAASAYKSATKNGSATAHRAYQAFLTAEQEHAGLAKAMEAELKQVGNEDVAAAALWYRLGLIKERHLDDPNGALKAYKNAVSCDPSAVPVSEAVARVMLAAGKTKQLIKFWETMLEGVADVATQVSIRFRMGEIAESGLSDLKLAKGFYESILQDHDPHFMPALESLQRVYRKFSEWEKLAGVFETLAELSDAPADKAQHLTRAGNVCRYESKNLERAEYYKQALDTVPGMRMRWRSILICSRADRSGSLWPMRSVMRLKIMARILEGSITSIERVGCMPTACRTLRMPRYAFKSVGNSLRNSFLQCSC